MYVHTRSVVVRSPQLGFEGLSVGACVCFASLCGMGRSQPAIDLAFFAPHLQQVLVRASLKRDA